MWNVIAHDWEPGIQAANVLENVEKGVGRNRRAGRGSNIVLHDGGHAGIGQDRSSTVEAVRAFLPNHLESGGRFIAFP
jgi:hypothetical protein